MCSGHMTILIDDNIAKLHEICSFAWIFPFIFTAYLHNLLWTLFMVTGRIWVTWSKRREGIGWYTWPSWTWRSSRSSGITRNWEFWKCRRCPWTTRTYRSRWCTCKFNLIFNLLILLWSHSFIHFTSSQNYKCVNNIRIDLN